MARLCLPKEGRDRISAALKNGELKLPELFQMDDVARNAAFAKYVGEYASTLNAKFEQAMLSNQKNALSNWVKKATNISEPVRRNMQKKIDRLEKTLSKNETEDFLGDLVEDKMGMKMTEEEVENVFALKQVIDEAAAKIPENSPDGSPERLEYGLAVRMFDTYVDDLTVASEKIAVKDRLKAENIGKNITDLTGLTKSMVGSIDASFPGRQGWRVALAWKPDIWAKGVATDLKTLFGTLKGPIGKHPITGNDIYPVDLVWADVLSRQNAMNGKYRAAKNGFGFAKREEAFPSSVPTRIKGIGRFYKASEDAYSATALRMRADYADAMIRLAEDNRLDTLDETVASGLGTVVSSMTGRGDLQTLAGSAETLNKLFFSPRLIRSHFNTLFAHRTDPRATPFAKKEALKNLFKMGTTLFGLLAAYEFANPDSVQWDPRKGTFGKVKVGQNYVDLTGGMSGLLSFMSRFAPTKIDGQWGQWKYSNNTRKWSNMWEKGYGESSSLEMLANFFLGKFAPAPAAVRDYLDREDFEGKTPTLGSTAKNIFFPISAKTIYKGFARGDDHMFAIALAELFGYSTSGTTMRGYGEKWQKLREQNPDEYDKVLLDLTEEFNTQAQRLEDSPGWQRMDNKERSAELDKIRAKLSDRALSRYGIK